MKQVHLLSLFIFLLGTGVGITGVVLAIIFGVHKESPVVCPSPTPCAPSIPITCSAKPISIKTGINSTDLSWTPELKNETSVEFKNASEYISKKLTRTLSDEPNTNSNQLGTTVTMEVSRFLEGKNKNVLCYAVGVAVGNKDVSLLPSTTSLEKKLDSDTTFIDPNVVSDSLDWCLELNNTIPTHITTSTHLPSTSSNITTSTHLPSTSSNITTSTHLPSTSLYNTIQTKQTPFCVGGYKYKGDIAVAFELTSDTNSTEVETFVKILLNYKNNPYSFEIDATTAESSSRVVLAPYPNTVSYYNPDPFYGMIKNINDIQIRLESYEVSKNFHSPIKNAHIADGFNFIRKIENHGENVGAVILVGVSDKFVNEAKDLSLQLQDLNYHVFTVSIGSANNFSTLASNEKSSFILSKPDSDFAVYISRTIGSFLLGESSICYSRKPSIKPTSSMTTQMITLPKVLTTTTEQCPNRLINQNIAFVFELSNSTGDLSVSQATSTFILNYLINQNQFNDQFSSFSLIPFPNPASYEAYGSIQDFDHLKKHNFDVALSFLFSVFNINGTYEANRSISDINGGLKFSQEKEFPIVRNEWPRTIILFANTDSGLVTAQETARDLKASNVTILTVAVTNEKSFSLTPLASSPKYSKKLSINRRNQYQQIAQSIVEDLVQLSNVCVRASITTEENINF